MTAEMLRRQMEQLIDLKKEVDELTQRAAAAELQARGVLGRDWYKGITRAEKDAQVLQQRLIGCRRRSLELIGQIYAWIDSVEDSRARRVLSLRYIDGLSWREVGAAIGHYDEQYPRRIHNRVLSRLAERLTAEEEAQSRPAG